MLSVGGEANATRGGEGLAGALAHAAEAAGALAAADSALFVGTLAVQQCAVQVGGCVQRKVTEWV
jgi:hypothetical protein